jgi:hypothetical protein
VKAVSSRYFFNADLVGLEIGRKQINGNGVMLKG